jgi:A/G-specific adenine glycosylase
VIDATCKSLLIDWFVAHGRTYPWRRTNDPYQVLIATFMLRRTGVGQVMNVYPEFIRRFPDLTSLAAAPADEIGGEIRPLGRVGRVGQLLLLVGAIQERHGGTIPRGLDALEALPGLRQYSARSVMCMAWGEPFIMLDPNSRVAQPMLYHRIVQPQAAHRPPTDRSA